MQPRKIWFGDKARPALFTRYRQVASIARVPFMLRSLFSTVLLDLARSPDELLAACAANCRNEIRRGDKEGLAFRAGRPTAEDMAFFSAFIASRRIGQVNLAYERAPDAVVTCVYFGRDRLASHLYIISPSSARARLIYSATSVATGHSGEAEPNNTSPKIKGIANRWLHFQDALFLRERGMRWCDLGGLGPEGGDRKIEGINRFKRSFGGVEITESNYDPVLLVACDALLNRLGFLAGRMRR